MSDTPVILAAGGASAVPAEVMVPGVPPAAEDLADLANEMLVNARHWEALRDPDRSCQYHQAAALYASAAYYVLANKNSLPAG